MTRSINSNLRQIVTTFLMVSVLAMGVGFASPASAEESTTPDQLSALIAQLKQRITELQAKLVEMGVTLNQPFENKPSTSVISVGATVETISALRVRSSASITPDNIIGGVPAGVKGEVVDGPIKSTYEGQEYTFWEVVYQYGDRMMTGWSAQAWLKVVDTNQDTDAAGDVVCKEFFFTPSAITAGDEASAQWRVNNALSVQIRSTADDFSEEFPPRSYGEYDLGAGTPTETTTYVLTATGNDGESVSCKATLIVKEADEEDSEDTATAPVCDYAYFTPATVSAGQKTTAKWKVLDAEKVVLVSSNGEVNKDFPASGTYEFVPEANTTYTFTGIGENGERTTCISSIIVDEYIKETTAPKCDYFTITPSSVADGEEVTAKWGTSNAKRVVLTSTIGDVNKEFDPKGEYSFVPEKSTVYRLAVYDGLGRKDSCSASVGVVSQNR